MRHTDRRGMTLVELLVALTISGVVISVTLSFMAQQNTAFQMSLERMSALRNARYAVTTLAQDLETLGTNVPGHQPSLVYGDDDVVVFSAGYATDVAGDPFAVFHDPDAPASHVRAPAASFTVPTTSVVVADSAYEVGAGVASPAEMLTFFFVADSITDRDDDFVLQRQVNGGDPEVVARHLLRDGATPFFVFGEIGGTSALDTVPGSAGMVRVTLVATNGLAGEHERSVRIERSIAFPTPGGAFSPPVARGPSSGTRSSRRGSRS